MKKQGLFYYYGDHDFKSKARLYWNGKGLTFYSAGGLKDLARDIKTFFGERYQNEYQNADDNAAKNWCEKNGVEIGENLEGFDRYAESVSDEEYFDNYAKALKEYGIKLVNETRELTDETEE